MNRFPRYVTALVIGFCISINTFAARHFEKLEVDQQQVERWNRFAKQLYDLHLAIIKRHTVRTEKEKGGYARQPNVYTETRYYDQSSNRLLSRIQRMNHNTKLIHLIEVFIYDSSGRVTRDYLAAYLPYHRNAPIQTLINLHGYHDGLHAYRQFDANGVHIYEKCEGQYAGKKLLISLEEDDIRQSDSANKGMFQSAVYKHCFSGISQSADAYLNPGNEIKILNASSAASHIRPDDDIETQIKKLSMQLDKNPKNPALLIKRGNLYFEMHEFDLAISDFSDAIELDKKADEAYFGRGLALGRSGQIREGIKDLSTYISRHPDSSRAYTKRGVRYLWIGKEKLAYQDLTRAVKLDPNNAEAHDDLGVVLARWGKNAEALKHFTRTVNIDPTYQKGHHNQAMIYYILGRDSLALQSVNRALALSPNARDTMMLKSLILFKLGRITESRKVKEDAEFLPEGNWSEHITVR